MSMSRTTWALEDQVQQYLRDHSLRDDELLRRLREETRAMPEGGMQISPEQGQLMALLVTMLGARRTLEIGTFTGYSALSVARALPPDGRVVACDVSVEWTSVGRRYWAEAGVADRIDLRLGPAAETLERLLAEGEKGRFDFAFIDADKGGYDRYYELCLRLLRPGGLIAIDNVLWGGRVADPSDESADTVAIRALNEKIHADPRVRMSMVPIGDGLTLALKL
jgi:predicted O-methyltransferase YrrM